MFLIADANAYVVLQEAKAQKQANEMLAKSITPELIEYNKMLRWDGKMPQVVGNNTPLLNIR